MVNDLPKVLRLNLLSLLTQPAHLLLVDGSPCLQIEQIKSKCCVMPDAQCAPSLTKMCNTKLMSIVRSVGVLRRTTQIIVFSVTYFVCLAQ